MKAAVGNILIVDDDPDVQEVLKDRLESLGYRAVPALTGRQGLELLDKESVQMVFLDIELPDMNGLEALKAIRKRQNDVAVVIVTAYGTIERAVQAMKDGAYDFIQKPLKPGYVALIVERAMERERLKREVEILSGEAGERYHLVVAKSSSMNLAVDSAKMAATTKSTVPSSEKAGPAKSCSPVPFTSGARESRNPSLRLTASVFPRNSLKASSSATKRELLRERTSLRKEKWSWRMVGLSFSMKSAIFPRRFKPSF